MSRTEIVTLEGAFAAVDAVAPRTDFQILVTLNGGEPVIVDLGPTIHGFKVYAPLRENRALFETVHVVNPSVVGWGDDDVIDMHVSEIERLVGETMEASDFEAFLRDLHLTRDAAAARLGISRRMVGYYAKGHTIPRYIALACAQLRHQAREPKKSVKRISVA